MSLDDFLNAFDPSRNGVADAFDPNKNGVADAFDPNKNGVANAFQKGGDVNHFLGKLGDTAKDVGNIMGKIGGAVSGVGTAISPIFPEVGIPLDLIGNSGAIAGKILGEGGNGLTTLNDIAFH